MAEERSLLELAELLKKKYKEYDTIGRLFYPDHPLPIEQCYLHLALVEEKDFNAHKDNQENKLKASRDYLLHDYERIQHSQRKLTPEQLLTECHTIPKRIYIEGAAGAGKTTLSQFITYQWSKDHPAWKHYDFLFRIRLRNLTGTNYPDKKIDFIEFLENECFRFGFSDSLTENEKNILSQYLKSKTKKVLFILDGYDELSLEDSALKALWKNLIDSTYDFILTSRPGMQKSDLKMNLNVAVLGFSDEQVKKYIDYFFDPEHTPDANVEDANQCLQAFHQNTNLWSLAHTPIQLELLCSIWGEELRQAPDITLTHIYTLMLEQLLKRYEQKRLKKEENKEVILSDIDVVLLLKEAAIYLEYLENVAFLGMERSKLVIPYTVIEEAYKELTVKPKVKADFFTTLRNLGLVTRDSNGRQMEYIHLTFQEYFAARYIVRCFRMQQSPKSYSTLNEFIAKQKCHRRYEVVWRFVSGLLKDEPVLLEQYFYLLLSEPRDLAEIYQFNLQLNCFAEGNLQINEDIKDQLLQRLKEWFQFLFSEPLYNSIDLELDISKIVINIPQIEEALRNYIQLLNPISFHNIHALSNMPSSLPSSILGQLMESLNDPAESNYAASILSHQNSLPESILQQITDLLINERISSDAYLALSSQNLLPEAILQKLVEFLKNPIAQNFAASTLHTQTLSLTLLQEIGELLNKNLSKDTILAATNSLTLQNSLPVFMIQQLVSFLSDKDEELRDSGAHCLYNQINLPESMLKQLIELLKDKMAQKYSAYILYYQNSLSESILQSLEKLLNNKEIRRYVAVALSSKIQLNQLTLQQLVELMKDKKDNDMHRHMAAMALSSQKSLPEPVIQQVIDLLSNKDIQRYSAESLSSQTSFSPSILQRLEKLLKNKKTQEYVAKALLNQTALPDSTLRQMVELLKDKSVQVNAAKVISHQTLLPKFFILQLVKLIKEKEVGFYAAKALSKQSDLPNDMLIAISNEIFEDTLLAIKNISVFTLCAHLNRRYLDAVSAHVSKLIILKCLNLKLSLYFFENTLYVDDRAQGEFSAKCQQQMTNLFINMFNIITNISIEISNEQVSSKIQFKIEDTNKNITNANNSTSVISEEKKNRTKYASKLDTTAIANQATQLFLGDEKSNPSHLDFNTWYHPEVCHYLLQLVDNNAKFIRVVFHDSGYDNNTTTFKKQLKELIVLSNCLNRPAFFIGKEPGADNHFISGIVKDGQLLFINPLGITQYKTCYQTFSELIKEETLNKLWFSNNLLQRKEFETEKLVSCGVIVLELAIHVLTTLTPDSFRAFWEQLKKTNSIAHEKDNLSYAEVDIENWLPDTLKKAQNALDFETYKKILCDIRLSHYNQLQNLPIARANASGDSVDEYLQKCKNESPAQVIFNALVFENKNITNIHELPEYQLLKHELDLSFSENKNNQIQSIEQLKNISSNTNAQPLIDEQNNNLSNQQISDQSADTECKALAERGVAYFVKQQFNQGMEYFNKALAINPNHFESLYYKGYYFLNVENNLVEAQKWFNQAVNTNIDPQHALQMNLKNQVLCYLERYKEAIAYYNQILQKPLLQIYSVADYLTKIGHAYLHLGSYKEAHDYYLKAINTINNDRDLMLDEKNARLLSVTYYRARAYLYQGNYTEAQFHYENAQRYKPVYFKSIFGKAFALFQLNQGKEATDLCQSVLATTSDNVYKHLIEALIHFCHQEYVKVIEKCDKVLVVKPRNIYSLLIKGLAYFHQKNYTEAIEYFDKILARYRFHVDSLFYKACALYGLGQKDEALDLYNKVKTIYPEFSHPYEMPIAMYDYWVQKYNSHLSHTESPQFIKEKNKEIKQAKLSDSISSQAQVNTLAVNFSSHDSMIFPLNMEGIKKYLKVSDESKYTDISHALENLSLFETDIRDNQDLWQKSISDVTEDACVLLYGLASEFFTLQAEEMVLDKLIYECLDDEQKPFFSYAQLWLPEHAILHNNVAVLEILLKYRQAISVEQNKINEFLKMALTFSLSPAIKDDRDDIAVLLLNAGAHLDNVNLSPADVGIDEKNTLHQIHLPIPTSLIWDKRLVLQSLIKNIALRFYKNRYYPSALQSHQISADVYLVVQFKQTGLSAMIKDRKLKQLEKQISETLNIKAVIVDDKNNTNDTQLDKEKLSFEEVLKFGKAQKELLNQATLIINENNLISFINSADLENSPTAEFINRLAPNQVLGFIKLGALYENILGFNFRTDDQDRVFYLLDEKQKHVIKQAQYWNLHYLCDQRDIDDTSLLIAERILTAIKNKDVDIDINAINSYGLTCLDKANKATRGMVSKTGLHVRNNGKLCLLLLKHGAKANKSIDDLVFSPSKYSEYRASQPDIVNNNTKVNSINFSQIEKAKQLYHPILQKGVVAMAESKNNIQGPLNINNLSLLQQETIANKTPVELYRYLASQGYTWRSLLNTHVFDLNLTVETRKASEAIVKELITKRDILDKDLYLASVQRLLGDENKASDEQRYFYNRVPKNTGPRNDLTGYKLEYYVLDILDKQQNDKPVFTVSIIAPGSRDLTSDIDTTVEVICHRPDLLPQLNWPDALGALNIQAVDPELVLQAGIVYHFNQLNCEKLGQTSAESRDSNVYVDGFMHVLAFPKFDDFVWQDENQKEKSAIHEIRKKTKQSFYQAQKHQRNVLELAASLLPLRAYYKDKSEEFIRQLKDLFAIHPLGKPNQASFDTLMQEVIAKTDALYQYQQTQVNTFKNDQATQAQYITSCNNGLGIALSQASLTHDRAEDFDAYVNNLLYAKNLYTVAVIRKKIKAIAKELSDEKITLTSLRVELQKLEKSIRTIKQKIEAETDEDIKDAFELKKQKDQNSHVNLHSNSFLPKLKDYVAKLEIFANLQVEQQKALIDAQLFALEAYMNYSAPYHIVKWQQSGDDNIRIDRRRVVLCSALQQIGFQLLHAQHYQNLGMESGQILYRVAKYGQRVADIFFGDTMHWFGDTEHTYHETEIILQRFKAEITAKTFGENLYDLLNLQIALVKDIKKNEDIPVHEKGHQAMLLCFKRYMKDYKNSSVDMLEDDILDAILSKEKMGLGDWLKVKDTVLIHHVGKLIVEAYRAKTHRYPETSGKQLCWGSLFNATGSNQQKPQTVAGFNNTNKIGTNAGQQIKETSKNVSDLNVSAKPVAQGRSHEIDLFSQEIKETQEAFELLITHEKLRTKVNEEFEKILNELEKAKNFILHANEKVRSESKRLFNNSINSLNYLRTTLEQGGNYPIDQLNRVKSYLEDISNKVSPNIELHTYSITQMQEVQAQGLFFTQRYLNNALKDLSPFGKDFKELLETIKATMGSRYSCFISYAWPIDKNNGPDRFIQLFLATLRDHLLLAGFNALLDYKCIEPGESLEAYMKNLIICNHWLLIGTPSLTQKLDRNAYIKFETSMDSIRKVDKLNDIYPMIPLLAVGNAAQSLPWDKQDRKYYDLTQGSYLVGLKKLLQALSRIPEQIYNNLWASFEAKYPEHMQPLSQQLITKLMEHEKQRQQATKQALDEKVEDAYSSSLSPQH